MATQTSTSAASDGLVLGATDTSAESGSAAGAGDVKAAGDAKAPVAGAKTDAVKPAEVAAVAAADVEIKLPDGMKADEGFLGDFKAAAKEAGLDSPKAQKVFEAVVKAQSAANERAHAEFEKQKADWQAARLADKEYGGKEYKANFQQAAKALEKFGSPELKTLLVESGFGGHPEVVRAFVRIGKAIAEDSIAGASGGASTAAHDKDAFARDLFPTMFKES